MTKRLRRRERNADASDARWQRKLEADEVWRKSRLSGLTGEARGQAEARAYEQHGPESWQAILFDTEAEAEADLAELAKANRMSIRELRLSRRTPEELK